LVNGVRIEVTNPLTFSITQLKDNAQLVDWSVKTMITFYEIFKESYAIKLYLTPGALF